MPYIEEIEGIDPIQADIDNLAYTEQLEYNENRISFGEVFCVMLFVAICLGVIFGITTGKI